MAGSSPWCFRISIGSFVAALLLGCSSDDRPGVESSTPPTPSATAPMAAGGSPPASASPLERARGATFTAPVATEFECDCPSRLLGSNGADRAAILRSLPLSSRPAQDSPSVQVLNPDGEIVWQFDDLELSDSDPAVAATSVLAFHDAVVAPATGGSLVGLGWADGSRLWELADVQVAPRRVPGQPELFTIAHTGFETHGGSSYSTHPRISLREAATGEPRWVATDIHAFALAGDGSRLLAVRFGDDAAELIRVELPAGAATSVAVPGWQGRGTSLVLNEDGTISSDIGDERFTVRIAWEEREPAVHDLGTGWTVEREEPPPLQPDSEIIASHDGTGMLLASTLDDEGNPVNVFGADRGGTQLWQRPASEVASWAIRKDGDVLFKNVSIRDVAEREAVVVLDLRTGFDDLRGAADFTGGPATRVYDLRTGTDLWEWGRSMHSGGQTIMSEHGLALVAEAGPLDETGAVAEPAELRAALLDLRTGAAEWNLRADATTSAGVASDGVFAFVTVRDGPWLLSTAQDT